jgi:antitoxin component of MazEF toxin-antitoxin module
MKLTYKAKLRKVGYTLTLVIPSDLVKAINLEDSEEIYLEVEEGDNKIILVRK